MADYPQPIEDVPIFDVKNFISPSNNLGGLTEEEIAEKFLRFPVAQGTENLKTTSVSGLLTATAGVEITDGDLLNKDNIIMNGTPNVNYIQFPDLTKQYTAALGPSPSPVAGTYDISQNSAITVNSLGQINAISGGEITVSPPTGIYTNANITVNKFGQVTAAANGPTDGNIISTQIITSSQNITFPPLTRYATIIVTGAGGNSGIAYYNSTNSTTMTGGVGGTGGAIVYPSFVIDAGTYMSCTFTSGPTGFVSLDYLPVPNTSSSGYSTNICIMYNGANGRDGSGDPTVVTPASGNQGNIKQNTYISGLVLVAEIGGFGKIESGTSPVPATLRGINYLTEFNALLRYNVVGANPVYGGGGMSQCINPSTGQMTYIQPGPGCVVIVSRSS